MCVAMKVSKMHHDVGDSGTSESTDRGEPEGADLGYHHRWFGLFELQMRARYQAN